MLLREHAFNSGWKGKFSVGSERLYERDAETASTDVVDGVTEYGGITAYNAFTWRWESNFSVALEGYIKWMPKQHAPLWWAVRPLMTALQHFIQITYFLFLSTDVKKFSLK